MFLDVNSIVESGGILLVTLIIFAESGLLIGFFLPGDTLLFAAGFFAAQGKLSLEWLIPILIVAAIAGFEMSYQIGKHTGPRIFKKDDGILFRHEYIMQAENFYEKHGSKTIFLARFVPVVRTIAPLLAGVGRMSRRKFAAYNVVGGVVWIVLVTLLGYWLGRKVPNIDQYLLPIVLIATAVSFSPTVFHIFKNPRARKALKTKLFRKR